MDKDCHDKAGSAEPDIVFFLWLAERLFSAIDGQSAILPPFLQLPL
jgi:hypothetical protein